MGAFKTIIKKIKNGYLGLIVLMVVSLVAGLHLMINPEDVNHFVIRGVGFVWVIEAVLYAIKIAHKNLLARIRSGDF
jgi:hypothetical protein